MMEVLMKANSNTLVFKGLPFVVCNENVKTKTGCMQRQLPFQVSVQPSLGESETSVEEDVL